jgi:hypothetical protein
MLLNVDRVLGIVPFPFHLCTYCIHANDEITSTLFLLPLASFASLRVTVKSEAFRAGGLLPLPLYALRSFLTC